MDEQLLGDILLSQLERLDHQRKNKTEEWQGILARGDQRLGPKKLDKLFKEWIKKTRKALVTDDSYSFAELIQHGAQKADIPEYRARATLLQIMDIDTNSSSMYLGFPVKSILQLEQTQNFRGFAGGSGVLMRSVDAPTAHNKLANSPPAQDTVVQNILFYLQQELRQSPYIAGISTRPGPLDPDGLLIFGLHRFNADMREYNEGSTVVSRPVIYLQAQIQLKHLDTGRLVLDEEVIVQYEFAQERDGTTVARGYLTNFFKKAAREIAQSVETYLAQ